jgi:hypothetical protein
VSAESIGDLVPGGPAPIDPTYSIAGSREIGGLAFVKLAKDGRTSCWRIVEEE